jgi:peptidyl-prolyl cis-trans isomerase C
MALGIVLDRAADEASVDVPDELLAAFQERKDELATPERRGVRNIVVATRRDAARVRRQLDAGADVARLARRVSIDAATRGRGGDLGRVARDDLVPAVGRSVFAAGPGEAYGPTPPHQPECSRIAA